MEDIAGPAGQKLKPKVSSARVPAGH